MSYAKNLVGQDEIPSDNFVFIQDGKIFTNSLYVAEKFNKRHDNILQSIKSLDCSHEFSALNFQEATYQDEQNKTRPLFLLTKDGFTFLAMGFSGKKAAKFKEDFIKKFNEMEKFINSKSLPSPEKPAFPMPKNFSEALRLYADEVERTERLENENKKLKPLAEYAKLSFNMIQSVPLSAFGKFLSSKVPGMGRNKVISFLIQNKLVFKNRSGILEPYSQYLKIESKQKFFDLKERLYKKPVYDKPKAEGGQIIGETREVYFQILIIKSGMEKVTELLYTKGLINSQQYLSITQDLPIWLNSADIKDEISDEIEEYKYA